MTKSIENRAASILDDEAEWLREDEARDHNIKAARAVSAAVLTTLGPRGMDKLLVDDAGMALVTNDGRIVLNEMGIEDPMADIVVAASTTQDNAAGDGTTTAAALTGELLAKAENLLDEGLHPMTIINGYDVAARRAREEINGLATPVSIDDHDFLRNLAATTLTGRDAEFNRDAFTELAVEAAAAVQTTDQFGEPMIDTDMMKTHIAEGPPVSESRLVEGAVVDKDPEHDDMPSEVHDASILLLDMPLRVTGPNDRETDIHLDLGADEVSDVRAREEQDMRELVDRIVDLGVDAVFTQDTMNDFAQHYLARAGILGIRRIGREDIEFLTDVLGATILHDLDDFSPEDLGHATIARDRDDEFFLIEGTEEFGGATILVRGETMYSADEYERALVDTLEVLAGAVNDGRLLPGGGAIEVELAKRLREYADSFGSREALAIDAFADALEVIPRTLAANSGLDPIDSLIDLRTAHESGNQRAGLDVFAGEVVDTFDNGVVETGRVKDTSITTAVETANIVLRVDDVIGAGPPEDDVLPPPADEGGPGSEEWGRDDGPS